MKKQTKSTNKTNMRAISMTAVGRWKTAGKKKRRKNKAKWDDYFNKEIYISEKKK